MNILKKIIKIFSKKVTEPIKEVDETQQIDQEEEFIKDREKFDRHKEFSKHILQTIKNIK